jgi:hypothetical protein
MTNMLRYLTIVPLLGALTLTMLPAEAEAQVRRRAAPPARQREVNLAGTYENISSGGTCYIYSRRNGYLFVNEQGSEALFRYRGPGRLEMVEGEWDDTSATVMQTRDGRLRIKFVSTGKPGYWERTDE